MIKCETINQYKCARFLENNFIVEYMLIELNDDTSLKIKDKNNKTAIIYFDEIKQEVILKVVEYWIVGELNRQYVCYAENDVQKLIESNGYIVPREIKIFDNASKAYAYLKDLVA